jgi:fructose-1,6-bisphosphatase
MSFVCKNREQASIQDIKRLHIVCGSPCSRGCLRNIMHAVRDIDLMCLQWGKFRYSWLTWLQVSYCVCDVLRICVWEDNVCLLQCYP